MESTTLPARISGQTEHYAGNGRQLGYPTANIKSDTNLVDGVYFGFGDLGDFKNHPALIFIGTPTTIGDTERRVEAYLLDIPDQDYYGLELSLDIRHYHRPNQTFKSIDELTIAMKNDEQTGRQWFARNPASA